VYRYTDTDSGLGRATPPRRAPSPGMSSMRHLPSPSGKPDCIKSQNVLDVMLAYMLENMPCKLSFLVLGLKMHLCSLPCPPLTSFAELSS
jgi:hypothetical protein